MPIHSRPLRRRRLNLRKGGTDVWRKQIAGHTEIMHHHEGFDFVPGNRALSAVETGLVNVMSRETVLRQYVDSVKKILCAQWAQI